MNRTCFIHLLALPILILAESGNRCAEAVDPPLPSSALVETAPTEQSIPQATSLFGDAPEKLILPPAPVLTTVAADGSETSGVATEADQAAPELLAMPPLRSSADDCWTPDLEHPESIAAAESLFVSKYTLASYTLIPAGNEQVGFNTFDFQHVMTARWFPRLLITPRFGWNMTNHDPQVVIPPGFNLTDIPAQLYEVAVDATIVLPIGERWTVQGSIAPSLFTDFQNTTHGAFRLPSKLVGYYQWSKAATIAAGIVYLDREDIDFVGYFGVILGVPGDDWKVEVLFPRSRIAYRVANNSGSEHWIYVAQEFIGGASWAMRHSYGLDDVVTYRDNKVMLGYEWLQNGQRRAFVEGGYVYDRELEFRYLGSGSLSSTGMFRVGMTF